MLRDFRMVSTSPKQTIAIYMPCSLFQPPATDVSVLKISDSTRGQHDVKLYNGVMIVTGAENGIGLRPTWLLANPAALTHALDQLGRHVGQQSPLPLDEPKNKPGD